MEKSPTIFDELCSFENLEHAFRKARKGKTLKPYVIKFENELKENLLRLRKELLSHTYNPRPLETFILRDPKTRKISKSDFRDRVVHHALCNVIEPLFDKGFIYDSHANRIGKGTFKAVQRFDCFKRKVSKNNTKTCFVLKADIKHYFDTVDHEILLSIINRKITDESVLWLIRNILSNHKTLEQGKGMPLGNLTSQFFANVYLNELDQFVKHHLKATYYLRYVDDFVILHSSKKTLETHKEKINIFLNEQLRLELHPDKSKILKLHKGISFLGFRIFFHHKLIRKKNIKRFERKFNELKESYKKGIISREKAMGCFEGWLAYISHAHTYKYRKRLTKIFNQYFPLTSPFKITNIKKHRNFITKVKASYIQFTTQKTAYLFKKGLRIKQIAEKRNIKESTVWEHLAQLVYHNQLSIWKILPKEKIRRILTKIHDENDKLKEIKKRILDDSIIFEDINCVLASIKGKNKKKNICHLIKHYQKIHCYRKCNPEQIKICHKKFDYFIAQNPSLEMKKKEFLYLFNNHMNICILPKKETAEKAFPAQTNSEKNQENNKRH